MLLNEMRRYRYFKVFQEYSSQTAALTHFSEIYALLFADYVEHFLEHPKRGDLMAFNQILEAYFEKNCGIREIVALRSKRRD